MYLCQFEFVPINFVKSVYLQESNAFATGYDYFSLPHFLTLCCFWTHKWEIPKEVDWFFRSDMGYAGFTFDVLWSLLSVFFAVRVALLRTVLGILVYPSSYSISYFATHFDWALSEASEGICWKALSSR